MRYRTIQKILCFACLLIVGTISNLRADYSIDWYSIDGGGGTSSGGVYTLTGAIGQADAGKLAGGEYELTGGFMSIVTAIQSPDSPLLTVIRAGNDVIISWPSSSVGFSLEETAALANPSTATVWSDTLTSPVIVDQTSQVTVPAPVGLKYYRLSKP